MEHSVASAPRRPAIPRGWYEPSTTGSAAFVLYAVTLFLVPAYLSVQVVHAQASAWLKLAALVPLLILSQQGLHLCGWVGHEGLHFTLHRNRYVSAVVGIFVSSFTPAFMAVGAAFSHWQHHRYTNLPNDPHCVMFPQYRTALARLLWARPFANRRFVRETLKVALGRPLEYPIYFPFGATGVRRLALLNVATQVVVMSGYLAFTLHDPAGALVAVWAPLLLAIMHSGLRIYVEHAGTTVGKYGDARTYSHPVLTALYFGNNYHLEHHLYPGVPCYRLPRIHRFLGSRGLLAHAGAVVDGRLFTYWHAVGKEYGYPTGSGQDDGDSPFVPPTVEMVA
jgi:beta-carotene hydroxylase